MSSYNGCPIRKNKMPSVARIRVLVDFLKDAYCVSMEYCTVTNLSKKDFSHYIARILKDNRGLRFFFLTSGAREGRQRENREKKELNLSPS